MLQMDKIGLEKKGFFTLLAGYFLQYLIGIIAIRVLTTIISPVEVGRINIIVAVALFLNVFVNGLTVFIQRNLLEWNDRGLARLYLVYYICFMFFIGILGSWLVISLKQALGINIKSIWLMSLIFGMSFFYNLNWVLIVWLNLFGRRFLFVLLSNITLLISIVIPTIMALTMARTAENWILGQILAQVFMLALSVYFLFKLLKPKEEKVVNASFNRDFRGFCFKAYNFAWPINVTSLLAWLQTQAYRFILNVNSGLEVIGLFTIGFGMGFNFINRFEILFNQFYNPVFYKELADSDTPDKKAAACNKFASYLIPAVLVLSIYIIVSSHFIAKVFVGDKFYAVTRVTIIWGVLFQLFFAVMTVYSLPGIAEQNTKCFIWPNLGGTLVLITGVFFLSKFNPYWGTGIAMVIGSFATFILMRHKMKKVLRVYSPRRKILFSLILSLPLVITMLALQFLFPRPTVLESITILFFSVSYMLLIQMILSRNWLFASIRLPFVDNIEQKINTIYLPDFLKILEP